MPAPTATASLDKALYAPGETMILTVDYTVDPLTVTVIVDGLGGTSGPVNAGPVKVRQLTASSSPSKTWTLQSDTGARAIYHATA